MGGSQELGFKQRRAEGFALMGRVAKVIKIVSIVLAGLMLILVGQCVFDPIDACLDHGGCWDYVDKVCRKDENNAQALCNRAAR